MYRIKAIVATLIGVVIVLGFLTWATIGTKTSTQPDQVALWYKSGPFQKPHYDHFIGPGDRELVGGLLDKVYKYPAGQRTYEFSNAQGADTSEITSLTKDNIELTTDGVMRFSLNTDAKVLQQFHEQIGIKFGAYMDGDKTSDGWREMLRTYPKQALQRAVNEVTQQYSWKELYNNSAIRKEWENKVNDLLPTYIKQAMGGDYFDDFSLTIQKPQLPGDLVDALRQTQVAIEQNNAQKQRNVQVQTELDTIRDLVKVLGPDGYNVYQAIKDGKISVLPIPEGSGVVVQGK